MSANYQAIRMQFPAGGVGKQLLFVVALVKSMVWVPFNLTAEQAESVCTYLDSINAESNVWTDIPDSVIDGDA